MESEWRGLFVATPLILRVLVNTRTADGGVCGLWSLDARCSGGEPVRLAGL